MRLGGATHQAEPESAARNLRIDNAAAAIKRLKNLIYFGGVDAGAAVLNGDAHGLATVGGRRVHR